jgi:hypothetical protein
MICGSQQFARAQWGTVSSVLGERGAGTGPEQPLSHAIITGIMGPRIRLGLLSRPDVLF